VQKLIGIDDNFDRMTIDAPAGTGTQQCADMLRNAAPPMDPAVLFTVECTATGLRIDPAMRRGADYT
jgi:hypothetical protein